MGTFRKTIKHSRSSKNLDDKIKFLDEDLEKTGILPKHGEKKTSDQFFNWREEFSDPLNLKEEVDVVIEEVKEKNRYLSSIENSIKKSKINEANKLFNEVYGNQVYDVVEKYISKYDGKIQNLREDIIVELEKKPKNLKFLEKRLDELDEKYNLLSRKISRDLVEKTKITEQSSVTFEQLKDHYQSLIGKLQKQLSMSGSGGGEVNLKYLDDVVGIATNPMAYDGKYLKYEHSSQKFVFSDVVGGGGIGTGGIELSDLSVINNAPTSESTLSYDNGTGVFTYTPPDLSGFATTGYVDSAVVGFITTGYVDSAVVGFVTTGYVDSAVVGFITTGYVDSAVVGFVTTGYVDSAVVGFITSNNIIAGTGITITESGSDITISATGSGTGGIELSDLSVINNAPTSESTLSYDNGTGVFTYTPQSTIGFLSSNNIIAGTNITITESGSDITISATGSGFGIGYSDLFVDVNPPGISTLNYDGTGVFTYTPPDLSGFATTGYVDSAVVGFATTGYVDSAVVGFITTGYVDSAVVGLATTGYVDSAVVGFVGINTSGTSTFKDVNVIGISTFGSNTLFNGGMQEAFDTITNSAGTVPHDCSNGHTFYNTSPTSDWTVNLTNLSLTAEYGTTISIVVNQNDPAFMPTSLQIGGVLQPIKWQGNSTPSGTASGIDVVSFSILNDGGTYVVLGQSVSFGGV